MARGKDQKVQAKIVVWMASPDTLVHRDAAVTRVKDHLEGLPVQLVIGTEHDDLGDHGHAKVGDLWREDPGFRGSGAEEAINI